MLKQATVEKLYVSHEERLTVLGQEIGALRANTLLIELETQKLMRQVEQDDEYIKQLEAKILEMTETIRTQSQQLHELMPNGRKTVRHGKNPANKRTGS